MKPVDVLIASHGHCFDGMASAAIFTHVRRAIDPAILPRYKSCGYGPGVQMIPEAWLDGGENAILDFRYTPTNKLRWYFDHHITGFGSAEEKAKAEERAASTTAPLALHFDATYGSCTKLIADVARETYDVSTDALAELVSWADIIDAARFESAEAATRRDEPVLQLASVVEHHGDGPFYNMIVPKLLERPLAEIARSDEIQALWRPLASAHAVFTERVKQSSKVVGPVVIVDLGDAPVETGAKFVTYALNPTSVYSVTLTRGKQHFKISVGYNPWCGTKRGHDIASICRKYDGGGHAAVGACSFPLGALDKAREAVSAIARQLGA